MAPLLNPEVRGWCASRPARSLTLPKTRSGWGLADRAVSQHLAKLRMSRLVTARRQGTFMFYSAADDHVRRLLAQALHHVDHIDPQTAEDTTAPTVAPRVAGQPA
ncbi:helix-turn-helix domain-containing protein [Catenuloplanes indicus]|uniref:HTH arsR-type domain-containing protein n=2 Tax=Catenuloplanes TaxID=33874 RepID=A0AAE3W0X6_9ACTN|nr:helix-turn-helix domain-containing protein [Catenuloplanes indicus]MDQ0366892.1 hypothetical protein [Catenuloplanes indicus]